MASVSFGLRVIERLRPLLLLSTLFAVSQLCAAQGFRADSYHGGVKTRALVVDSIDNAQRVKLPGNVREEASAENDRGEVVASLPMEHMQLVLQRPAELEARVRKEIDDLSRRGSPTFHHWLTAQQYGEKYGPAPSDIARVTEWLTAQGFRVDSVPVSGMFVEFSGTAGTVKQAFHTSIHALTVNGEPHIANVSAPEIPVALAGVVAGVHAMHNFMPHPMHKKVTPQFTTTLSNYTYYAVAPGDLATIYNLNPTFASGISGQGQQVVVIEDTLLAHPSDVATFRTAFGLSSAFPLGTFSQITATGTTSCSNSGVNADEGEAALDAEWAGASAPSAAVVLASCADTSTVFGGLIALQNLLNATTPPSIVSISYGECEAFNGAAANQSYVMAYQQAAAEGVSVYVSAGDEGAASCDANRTRATHGIAVSGFASTPYNVAVGGTDFGDLYASAQPGGIPYTNYWNASNDATLASALSYIPEVPWNDSCASALIDNLYGYAEPYGTTGFCNSTEGTNYFRTTASGSGGPSSYSVQPAFQMATDTGGTFGLPTSFGGHRYLPDISLFAANGTYGHFFVYCLTDTAQGGVPCDYTNENDIDYLAAGGTSFSSPILAGVQALINQKVGATMGNPLFDFYSFAGLEFGASGNAACDSSLGTGIGSSCVFNDVTLGDIAVNCTGPNCYGATGSSVQGALSTSVTTFARAYSAGLGWDYATGLGTPNVTNLVNLEASFYSGGYPAGLASSTGLATSGSPVVSGASVTLTATVTPGFGLSSGVNVGNVTWGANTGCSPVPVVKGVATCTTTSLPNGYQSITANYTCFSPSCTLLQNSNASLMQGVNVPATHLVVTAASPERGGTSFAVTVSAEDANGEVVPYYTGTVTFTSSDPRAALPANATLTNGTGSFMMSLSTDGMESVTATDTVAPSITGSTNVTVQAGSVWLGNGNSSLSAFNRLGTPYSGVAGYANGTLGTMPAVAIDSGENVWTAGSGGVGKFDYLGGAMGGTPYTGGGVNSPRAIAIDGAGAVWVTNSTGSVSVLSSEGVATSPAAGYVSGNTAAFGAVAIDVSGNVWLTSPASNAVVEILGAGTPVTPAAVALSAGAAAVKP